MNSPQQRAPDMVSIVFVRERNNYYSVVPLLAAASLIEGAHPAVVDIGELDRCPSPLSAAGPALYAFSFNSIDFAADREKIIRLVKSLKARGAILICGGPHPTARPDEMLALGMDAVVAGDGEQALRHIVELIRGGEAPKGVYRHALEGLDSWPPFLENSRYYKPIEITRGCPHGCAFCQTSYLFSRKPIHRSVDNVVKYVRKARERNFRDFRFITPNALSYGSAGGAPDYRKVKELLAGLRECIGSEGRIFFGTFPSEIRPEFVEKDIIRFIKGVVDNRRILIGAQTGSDRMMRHARRGHTVRDVERAIGICLAEGFSVDIDLIFGMPAEEERDLRATLDFMGRYRQCDVSFNLHYFMPLPGSPWENERPAALPAAVMKELDSLVGMGKAWGNWKRQMAVGNEPRKNALKKNND